MKDLLTQDGKPEGDLSKRMADNVVEALVQSMADQFDENARWGVYAYSNALSALSLLAIAEQLQALAVALEPDPVADGIVNPEDENAGSWAEYKWRYGKAEAA